MLMLFSRYTESAKALSDVNNLFKDMHGQKVNGRMLWIAMTAALVLSKAKYPPLDLKGK